MVMMVFLWKISNVSTECVAMIGCLHYDPEMGGAEHVCYHSLPAHSESLKGTVCKTWP